MLKGYETENQKLLKQHNQMKQQVTELAKQNERDQNQIKELKLKALKERSGVYIEEDDDEVNIQAKNVMGAAQSISQKQLEELYEQLRQLQKEKDDHRKDMSLQATQFKAQISKLRDDKNAAEKKVIDMEFVIGETKNQVQTITDQNMQHFNKLSEENKEL